VCFVNHRIHFVSADGSENENPTFQNIFVYLGHDPERFAQAFEPLGYVMWPSNNDTPLQRVEKLLDQLSADELQQLIARAKQRLEIVPK
jgi:hypothetical protein